MWVWILCFKFSKFIAIRKSQEMQIAEFQMYFVLEGEGWGIQGMDFVEKAGWEPKARRGRENEMGHFTPQHFVAGPSHLLRLHAVLSLFSQKKPRGSFKRKRKYKGAKGSLSIWALDGVREEGLDGTWMPGLHMSPQQRATTYLIDVVKYFQNGEDTSTNKKAHLTSNITWRRERKPKQTFYPHTIYGGVENNTVWTFCGSVLTTFWGKTCYPPSSSPVQEQLASLVSSKSFAECGLAGLCTITKPGCSGTKACSRQFPTKSWEL